MIRRAGTILRDDDPPPAHGPRVRFDSLFADPRHYRGDLRLFRTAIRRGWLDDAPDDVRAALVRRFEAAVDERRERCPEPEPGKRPGKWVRPVMAECWAMIELERDNLAPVLLECRYWFRGGWSGQTTGRPRSRARASDFRSVIDANAIRQRAKAAGIDLRTVEWVTAATDPHDAPGAWSQRVAVVVAADRVYGLRLTLVCPRCGTRRGRLFPSGCGMRCRACL